MEQVKRYIEQALGAIIQLDRAKTGRNLPFFISKGFEFFKGELFEKSFVLIKPLSSDFPELKRLDKAIEQIQESFNSPVVVAFESLPAALRKRMVIQKTG